MHKLLSLQRKEGRISTVPTLGLPELRLLHVSGKSGKFRDGNYQRRITNDKDKTNPHSPSGAKDEW